MTNEQEQTTQAAEQPTPIADQHVNDAAAGAGLTLAEVADAFFAAEPALTNPVDVAIHALNVRIAALERRLGALTGQHGDKFK